MNIQPSLLTTIILVLSIICTSTSTLQSQPIVTEEALPTPLQSLIDADLFRGAGGRLHIVGLAEESAGFMQANRLQFYMARQSNGTTSTVMVSDTGLFWFDGLHGEEDRFRRSVAIDANDDVLLCWSKQRVQRSDLPPWISMGQPRLQCMKLNASGIRLTLFDLTRATNPSIAVGPDNVAHFTWENVWSVRRDSNYAGYAGRIFYRFAIAGGALSNPIFVDSGFSSRVASQTPNTAHLVWLKGDSATAMSPALKYRSVTSGVMSSIITLREQLYAPDSLVLHVDTARIVHVGWLEKRPSNLLKVFLLRLLLPNTIVIDSSQMYGPYPGSARFAIQADGVPHALWNTVYGARDGLFYSTGRLAPLFNTVKSFTTSFLRANPIALFLRTDNRASAVFEDAGAIRYISNLETTTDTTMRILTGFIPRTSNHPVAASASNDAWLVFGRSLGGSGNRLWLAKISDQNSGVNEPTLRAFMLGQNYPNPFNPRTNIGFRVERQEMVQLIVYDLLGREVTRIVDELKDPGEYRIAFDAAAETTGSQGMASGIYIYRLLAGGFAETKKMVIIR